MLPESAIPACVPVAPVEGDAPITLDPMESQPESAPASVAQLLQASRDANLSRLRASRQKLYIEAELQAARALRLREEAHDRDPEHLDGEWQHDKGQHEALVVFLRNYPSIP